MTLVVWIFNLNQQGSGSLRVTGRRWWPAVLWTDHGGPALQPGRAFTTVPAGLGSIMVSLWSGGPPRVPNRGAGFFSSLQSGARGEAWLHASADSCWHACVIKPNETAHCSQRMDTGRRSNRANIHPSGGALAGLRQLQNFIFIPLSALRCRFGSHDQRPVTVTRVCFHVTLT